MNLISIPFIRVTPIELSYVAAVLCQDYTIGIEISGSQVHSNLIRQALKSVLKDEGFKIEGWKANAATESPRCVFDWVSMPENEKSFIVGGMCLR